MGKLCRVQEFAKLAGITSKALRHYERVGLLKPARSNAGYRLYSERHLDRLEHIVRLKVSRPPVARDPDGAGADSGRTARGASYATASALGKASASGTCDPRYRSGGGCTRV